MRLLVPCMIYIFLLFLLQRTSCASPKNYVVYLGTHSHHAERRLLAEPEVVTRAHHELLASVSKSDTQDSSKKLIYSYNKVFNGFAATLSEDEAKELAEHPDVITVIKSRKVHLQTTHSWEFTGNYYNEPAHDMKSLWEKTSFGEDVIIANIDTGVWPESKSFSDEGMGPIPKRFKGKCETGDDPKFKCNRKLIGARYFYKGAMADRKAERGVPFNHTLTPRDMEGHGTHTLSTAGGSFVAGANIRGFANGTAKGGAPKARVVAYKIGWDEGGEMSDIDTLAAFEAAILDGVDIINYSVGTYSVDSYFELDIIGAFHAMKNGITVVAGAANTGPHPSTVVNLSPWKLTVAASTMDREFANILTLGNNHKIKAARFYCGRVRLDNNPHPLINGADASVDATRVNNASRCLQGSLDPAKVKGKIVVCLLDGPNPDQQFRVEKNFEVGQAGGIGMILANSKDLGLILAPDDPGIVPLSHISYSDGQAVYSYINSTRAPVVSFGDATTNVGVKPAPVMADFSARGPNRLTPHILKPDITAPGVTILAASSEADKLAYYLSSGTSMSAPHVAGVAALLKKMHPQWSTAAIRSALMTTASPLDNTGKPMLDYDLVHEASPFAYGSGHMRPSLASDPGLVYDMNHEDHLNFLCAHHYNNTVMQKFTGNYNCPKSFSILDYNYPSITIPDFSGNAIVTRKLKNVGAPGTYVARVDAPPGVSIIVEPKTMIFSAMGQVIEYKLTFTSPFNQIPKDYVFGCIVWSDGKHVVRSPIVVKGQDVAKVGSKAH